MKLKKIHIAYHKKLFYSVTTVFLIVIVMLAFFQYSREKQHREQLMNVRLTAYNNHINSLLSNGINIDSLRIDSTLRVTVIDFSGNVIFDSEDIEAAQISNHRERPEIKSAMTDGTGYEVIRHSKTTNQTYFYAAKRFDTIVVRTAVAYNAPLINSLKVDFSFLWIVVLIFLALGFFFYKATKILGRNISQLRDFAVKADNGEVMEENFRFPNNELGETSKHIVEIYNRLKKTKQQLQDEKQNVIQQQDEQARIKRQLTHNIAHELKTPVSSIQGYLETILNNNGLSEEQKDTFIRRCYQQSTRLAALLHDISKLTRLEEAPNMIRLEEVDVAQVIANAINDVSLSLADKNMTAINHTENQQIKIEGNLSLIYSIFRNLLDNTILYSGEKVSVQISCYKEDRKKFYFKFADNGIGVADEHLPRIFERFYRIDEGRSRKSGGTGLGLAVVKNAVIFHNGIIVAKRGATGGLEFNFSISKNK